MAILRVTFICLQLEDQKVGRIRYVRNCFTSDLYTPLSNQRTNQLFVIVEVYTLRI
jgi:hypothetical protein